MGKVPQHLIEEATRRGIVPGAMVYSAFSGRKAKPELVLPYDQWQMVADEPNNGRSGYYLRHNEKWAEVATLAPQSEGLKEGDSCECGPAMRAAIIEEANAMGLKGACDYPYEESTTDPKGYCIWDIGRFQVGWGAGLARNDRYTNHAPEAFIAKMRVTAAQPKPIKIGDHIVEFRSGSIKVGCTTIDNATVRSIAEKLVD